MIARITGKIAECEEKGIIIETGGMGYRVAALAAVRDSAKIGQEIALRIHHHSSADSQALYGFATAKELEYFELLLAVPAVGPKTAMGILEAAPPDILEQAVAENDVTLLTKVSGVGKRTAERVLIELKERIAKPAKTAATGVLQNQTVEALISIGFTPMQARGAAAKLPKTITTVEDAVKAALHQAGS